MCRLLALCDQWRHDDDLAADGGRHLVEQAKAIITGTDVEPMVRTSEVPPAVWRTASMDPAKTILLKGGPRNGLRLERSMFDERQTTLAVGGRGIAVYERDGDEWVYMEDHPENRPGTTDSPWTNLPSAQKLLQYLKNTLLVRHDATEAQLFGNIDPAIPQRLDTIDEASLEAVLWRIGARVDLHFRGESRKLRFATWAEEVAYKGTLYLEERFSPQDSTDVASDA